MELHLGIEAAVELAIKAVKKEIEVTDPEVVRAELIKAAGTDVTLLPFEGKDNYYLILLDSVIF